MSNNLDGMMSSYLDDYETPNEFIAFLNIHFDLDACCSSVVIYDCNRRVTFNTNKAPKFFTESDDALSKEWHGKVWMNPPYGNVISNWLKYAYEQSRMDYNEFVTCLVPARTDTKWFHEIASKGNIQLLKGRLNFLRGGVSVGSAPFPSMLVTFDKNITAPTITTLEWKQEKVTW